MLFVCACAGCLRHGKRALLSPVEQSSEQPAGRIQSTAPRRVPRGRDARLFGRRPPDPRPQGGVIRVQRVLQGTVPRPPDPAPDRGAQRRTVRRAPRPGRVYVPGRGKRGPQTADHSAEDGREPEGQGAGRHGSPQRRRRRHGRRSRRARARRPGRRAHGTGRPAADEPVPDAGHAGREPHPVAAAHRERRQPVNAERAQ